MEIYEWCVRILSADSLEEKLLNPPILTDFTLHPPLLWDSPTRPTGMEFQRHTKEHKLPPFEELHKPDKRAICLHRFAGHELLAVEMMAYALLAFPKAPKHFRRGLANTLKEEQGHVRLYQQRLLEMGVQFGDMPLYKHFWTHTKFLTSPIEYLSIVSLTFEMANLDFAPFYHKAFSKHGDDSSAFLMNKILEDEIGHVSFGMHWLNKFKDPNTSSWDSWRNSVPELLPVKRSRGSVFFEEHRKNAGIPDDWILKIKQSR